MKCINKRKRKGGLLCALAIAAAMLSGCFGKELPMAYDNESARFGQGGKTERLPAFASDLCVSDQDVPVAGLSLQGGEAAGLFDVSGREVVFGKNLHERLYPASTTKILTAYVVMKYGDPDDVVTVSAHATDLPVDAQVCGFEAGDQIKLSDLLHGLLVHSGNDAAIALAEHVGGSEEAFVELMNAEARGIGATCTHFTNPDGLHDDDHYTTAYDLYLMFNAALSYDEFRESIALPTYTAKYTGANGADREMTWENTNLYLTGNVKHPKRATVVGGKTGTTEEAGACLVILSQNEAGNDYISVVLKEPDKIKLYSDMTNIINKIPK